MQLDIQAHFEELKKFVPSLVEKSQLAMYHLEVLREVAPKLSRINVVAASWVKNAIDMGHVDVSMIKQLLETEALYRDLHPAQPY